MGTAGVFQSDVGAIPKQSVPPRAVSDRLIDMAQLTKSRAQSRMCSRGRAGQPGLRRYGQNWAGAPLRCLSMRTTRMRMRHRSSRLLRVGRGL